MRLSGKSSKKHYPPYCITRHTIAKLLMPLGSHLILSVVTHQNAVFGRLLRESNGYHKAVL